MKKIREIIVTLLIAAHCSLVAKAEGDLGTLWGYAKTFYNVYNWMWGSTAVTPAYALGMWRLDSTGCYSGVNYENRWRITRNLVTGDYIYSFTSDDSEGNHSESNDVFAFSSYPARRNYHCDMSTTDPETGETTCYVYDLLEDFSVHVWTGTLQKSGGYPPGQPYPVWMKAAANRLANSCVAPTPDSTEFRKGGQISDSGTTTLKFGMLDYDYAWPPLVWCGAAYDY